MKRYKVVFTKTQASRAVVSVEAETPAEAYEKAAAGVNSGSEPYRAVPGCPVVSVECLEAGTGIRQAGASSDPGLEAGLLSGKALGLAYERAGLEHRKRCLERRFKTMQSECDAYDRLSLSDSDFGAMASACSGEWGGDPGADRLTGMILEYLRNEASPLDRWKLACFESPGPDWLVLEEGGAKKELTRDEIMEILALDGEDRWVEAAPDGTLSVKADD